MSKAIRDILLAGNLEEILKSHYDRHSKTAWRAVEETEAFIDNLEITIDTVVQHLVKEALAKQHEQLMQEVKKREIKLDAESAAIEGTIDNLKQRNKKQNQHIGRLERRNRKLHRRIHVLERQQQDDHNVVRLDEDSQLFAQFAAKVPKRLQLLPNMVNVDTLQHTIKEQREQITWLREIVTRAVGRPLSEINK